MVKAKRQGGMVVREREREREREGKGKGKGKGNEQFGCNGGR